MVTLRSKREVHIVGGGAAIKITQTQTSKTKTQLSGRNVAKQRARQTSPGRTVQASSGKIMLKLRKVFIVEKKKLRTVNLRTNKEDIVFGEGRFVNFSGPKKQEYHKVYKILAKHHSDLDLKRADKGKPDVPGLQHAAKGVTIDGWIRVILSQHTNNNLGETAHAEATAAFPYVVNGKKVIGTKPNYHDMRLAPLAAVQQAFYKAGLHKKSAYIQDILRLVYEENRARHRDKSISQDQNEPNAPDFVPGLLSIDFMNGLSMQEKYDKLVSYGSVGPKTAACILSFFYNYDVFAVDTHVYQMSRWLNWIPEDCSEVDAFAHLDSKVPKGIKHELHQAFWNHRQQCIRCKSKADPKSKEWKQTVCPLERMLDRSRLTLKQVAELARVNKIKHAAGAFAQRLADKRAQRAKVLAEKKAHSPKTAKTSTSSKGMSGEAGEQLRLTITDNWGVDRNRNVLAEKTWNIITESVSSSHVALVENGIGESTARMEVDVEVDIEVNIA